MKLWIYQSPRALDDQELATAHTHCDEFCRNWTSHERPLKAAFEWRDNRFLFLMVDESAVAASGCAIDKSVNLVRRLNDLFALDFFDRMRFSYRDADGTIQTVSRDRFAELYRDALISDNTPVFNTMLNDTADLNDKWELPLSQSWHKRMV